MYFAAVSTVPTKFGSGSKVTTPVEVFTVYVPSPDTVNDVNVQFVKFVSVFDEQNRTDVTSNVVPVPALSFARGEMVWSWSFPPVEESFVAVGTGGDPTVAVISAAVC
jgi:hypothetical protein